MPDVPFHARSSTGWTGGSPGAPSRGALDREPHDGGCITETATTSGHRAPAMALPEATEKQHFRLKVPLWQVRDHVAAQSVERD